MRRLLFTLSAIYLWVTMASAGDFQMPASRGRAGRTTETIASGTVALGTAAIASAGACPLVSVNTPGVLATDTLLASFNSDPTGVTGYATTANGVLTIFAYPTVGKVNLKVCNNTSASITPGAITLNYRVVR